MNNNIKYINQKIKKQENGNISAQNNYFNAMFQGVVFYILYCWDEKP